jgi:hypothetical protein
MSEKSLDARARRAARRVGLMARKSRWRVDTIDNFGGYRLIDPWLNVCIDGERFDLSAEYVIESCEQLKQRDNAGGGRCLTGPHRLPTHYCCGLAKP